MREIEGWPAVAWELLDAHAVAFWAIEAAELAYRVDANGHVPKSPMPVPAESATVSTVEKDPETGPSQ